jgi:hypothetical protein
LILFTMRTLHVGDTLFDQVWTDVANFERPHLRRRALPDAADPVEHAENVSTAWVLMRAVLL